MTEKKIPSLQGVRAIAFLSIFLYHITVEGRWGPYGVSIFLVLSGFLMSYHYGSKCERLPRGIVSRLRYAYQKIKKLYPLHIVMLVFAAFANYISFRNEVVWGKFGLKFLLNLLLIDDWFPRNDIFSQFNIVTWYLSAMVFLYFLFPILIRLAVKISKKRLLLYAVLTYLVMVCVALLSYRFMGERSWWITYESPYFRVGDFWIGILVGLHWADKRNDTSGGVFNYRETLRLECCAGLIEVGLMVLSVALIMYESENQVVDQFANDILFLPLSAFIVYVFASAKGFVSHLLEKGAMQWLGNLSPYAFLIHVPVINYVHAIAKRTVGTLPIVVWGGISLMITLGLASAYANLTKKQTTERSACMK